MDGTRIESAEHGLFFHLRIFWILDNVLVPKKQTVFTWDLLKQGNTTAIAVVSRVREEHAPG